MKGRRLTFCCELETEKLAILFETEAVIDDLVALEAGVALGLLDLSPARAAVVRRLNQAGIPLTAWLLLPEDQGYWFNVDNAEQATARYAEFKAWTAEHQLAWDAVALDVAPDLRDVRRLLSGEIGSLLPPWLRRLGDGTRIQRAQDAYIDLIDQIRADGYQVVIFQFPFIVDERLAGSELLQRLLGILDLPTDREVLVLYSSFAPAFGPGLIGSYGPNAQAIAVGSTGSGVQLDDIPPLPTLGWEELARDLRLAGRWSDPVFVFSLEGCVEQGFLARLRTLNWDELVDPQPDQVRSVNNARKAVSALLWASTHPWWLLAGLVGGLFLLLRLLDRGKSGVTARKGLDG